MKKGLLLAAFLVVACSHRELRRDAEVRIVVSDASTTLGRVAAAAEQRGGYVTESHLWRDGNQMRATITLHVPPEQLTATLAEIREMAVEVESERVTRSAASESAPR